LHYFAKKKQRINLISLPWCVSVFLLSITGLYTIKDVSVQIIGPSMTMLSIPQHVSSWQCTKVQQTNYYRDPNVDIDWSMACMQGNGLSSHVYVGYIKAQGKGKRILSPTINYLDGHMGQGWYYVDNRSVKISFEIGDNSILHANETVLGHGNGNKVAILYWYQIGKETYSNEVWYRVSLMFRRLLYKRTDAAIVYISAQVKDNASVEAFSMERVLAINLYNEIKKLFS